MSKFEDPNEKKEDHNDDTTGPSNPHPDPESDGQHGEDNEPSPETLKELEEFFEEGPPGAPPA